MLRYLRERGLKRLALLTATDATGQEWDTQFAYASRLRENRAVQIVVHEHFNLTDLSVSAQMQHIKAARPQALLTFSTGSPFATVLRGINDAGLSIPIVATAGNMTFAQMTQYEGLLPKELLFPATRGIAPESGVTGAVKNAQDEYFKAFSAARIRPDFANNLAWDPTMIVVDALRHLGPSATANQIRDYIAGLKGWAGVDGVYDFRELPQRGIGATSAVIYRWDDAKKEFATASSPGGRPFQTSPVAHRD
jgi:branched-chain amino acid transport system substrate-binding protein